MTPLYFRITERPDPGVFDPRWVEIPGGRFALDRGVWRGVGVSRNPAECVVLRADPDEGVWELRNRAPGRVVILHDGRHRYDVRTGMAMTLLPGVWRGTLPEAFTFVVTTVRPQAPTRRAGDVRPPDPVPEDATRPRTPAVRASTYLGKHPVKRFALAYLWREHLVHTPDVAEDLPPATVGRAFGVPGKTVTRWREDLAENVYGERGHQGLIRDLVVQHGVLTRADVGEADRYVAEHLQVGS